MNGPTDADWVCASCGAAGWTREAGCVQCLTWGPPPRCHLHGGRCVLRVDATRNDLDPWHCLACDDDMTISHT